MFVTDPKQPDILTEFLELQRGLLFHAKVCLNAPGFSLHGLTQEEKSTSGSRPLMQGHEDVYVLVDLLGMHLCTSESKVLGLRPVMSGLTPLAFLTSVQQRSKFMEFEIEAIVKYSYNRAKKTFTFSYMDADGLLNEYKLISDKARLFTSGSVIRG